MDSTWKLVFQLVFEDNHDENELIIFVVNHPKIDRFKVSKISIARMIEVLYRLIKTTVLLILEKIEA